MSERREFNAGTVEEAVDRAAATFGVEPQRLDFEVVDRGSAGFLGMGSRDARILVGVPEPADDTMLVDEEAALASKNAEQAEKPSTDVQQEVPHQEQVLEHGEPSSIVSEAPEDLILAADNFMTTLLDKAGFDATVDAYDAEEVITVDVATKETGLLIGQKGETIDAIQHLLNISVYRDRPFVKRMIVDSEGYRQRRVEALQGMAHRTARRALREKRSLSLPPMSAAERRVIHLYLKENSHVTTSSEGQEEDRRVVVSPL
jgi:spoIIIJ-associated protein